MNRKTIVAVYIVAILVVVAGVCALASGKLAVKPHVGPIVNAELAKQLVAGDFVSKDAYDFIQTTLDQLTPKEMEKLYQMIDDDIEQERNIIVPTHRLAQCVGWFVMATIKDRLGTLAYDQILEGTFGKYDWGASCGDYYYFTPASGNPILVYVAIWTVTDADSWQTYTDFKKEGLPIRVYVQNRTGIDGGVSFFVVKMETIEK